MLTERDLERKSVQYRKALLRLIKRSGAGHIGGDLSFDPNQALPLLQQEKAAMIFQGPWIEDQNIIASHEDPNNYVPIIAPADQYRIALPLALPAVVSLCILDGVATWNEFILAQIFLRSDELRTLPLGLVQFSTQFSTQYDQLAAAVLIAVVPIVLVFLFFQRYFVAGMGGAVK